MSSACLYVDLYVDCTDIITVLETPELELSATARTIAYRFSGKVDFKET